MITQLARWWLMRRGYALLKPPFNGMALGNCTAVRLDNSCSQYLVTVHPDCEFIVLNHTTIYHHKPRVDERKRPLPSEPFIKA